MEDIAACVCCVWLDHLGTKVQIFFFFFAIFELQGLKFDNGKRSGGESFRPVGDANQVQWS